MKRLIFYGDSNTYGYDPRGFMGMRYPKEVRWTEKVKDYFRDEYDIIEEGQNGRLLPTIPGDEVFLKSLTKNMSVGDLLFIMLGTNDILLTDHPDADKAISKMKQLLDWVKENNLRFNTVIIGPVPISEISEDIRVYYEESLRMNAGFKDLCEKEGIEYFDAADWNISLAYDGVHFSETGCSQFADNIIQIIALGEQNVHFSQTRNHGIMNYRS